MKESLLEKKGYFHSLMKVPSNLNTFIFGVPWPDEWKDLLKHWSSASAVSLAMPAVL